MTISFDRDRVDRGRVYRWLSREAYWSLGIGRDVVERFSFAALAEPQRAMERHNPHVYARPASGGCADRNTP
jgi:hypothetical protein